nr:VOC family protein [Pseudomonas sp. BMS12]
MASHSQPSMASRHSASVRLFRCGSCAPRRRDHYWQRLGAGSAPEVHQCGWLKDRYGLFWPVVPAELLECCRTRIRQHSERSRPCGGDMAELRRAFVGESQA